MSELRTNDYSGAPEVQFLMRHLGDPAKEKAKFDAISPLRHIESVKIPIFVFHGLDDPVADIAESKKLVDLLQDHHVPCEKHFLEHEGHGLSHFDDVVDIFTALDAFLTKNMAPQGGG